MPCTSFTYLPKEIKKIASINNNILPCATRLSLTEMLNKSNATTEILYGRWNVDKSNLRPIKVFILLRVSSTRNYKGVYIYSFAFSPTLSAQIIVITPNLLFEISIIL